MTHQVGLSCVQQVGTIQTRHQWSSQATQQKSQCTAEPATVHQTPADLCGGGGVSGNRQGEASRVQQSKAGQDLAMLSEGCAQESLLLVYEGNMALVLEPHNSVSATP